MPSNSNIQRDLNNLKHTFDSYEKQIDKLTHHLIHSINFKSETIQSYFELICDELPYDPSSNLELLEDLFNDNIHLVKIGKQLPKKALESIHFEKGIYTQYAYTKNADFRWDLEIKVDGKNIVQAITLD